MLPITDRRNGATATAAIPTADILFHIPFPSERTFRGAEDPSQGTMGFTPQSTTEHYPQHRNPHAYTDTRTHDTHSYSLI